MEVRKAFQELMGPRSIKNTHQIHIIHFHFEVVNRVFFSMHLLGACEQVQFLSRYYPNILLFHFFYSFGLKHYQNLTLIYPAHQIIYALLISISSLYSSVKLHMHHVITWTFVLCFHCFWSFIRRGIKLEIYLTYHGREKYY